MRRRDLKHHQQRHHSHDNPQYRRAGIQAFRVKHHRTVDYDLEGKRVKSREEVGISHTGGNCDLF
jgi:hypothetical protein